MRCFQTIRNFIAAVLLCLPAASPEALAQSRGKIAGTVTDAETGESLPGVNVVVEGTTLGTATDVEGDFFIANLRPGTYSLRATFIGYRPTTITEVIVTSGRTAEVDFEMEQATLGLDEEIVIVAERPLVEKDNTTSLVVLEADEITSRPTAVLTDVLTSLPSVNVENGETRVRGGALNEVAFLLDGTRVGNPFDYQPYTRINISAIQEMEVITGAFNAEYGEAQSGIINVVTKEGSQGYEVYLDARYSAPRVPHFGPSLYDRGTDVFWENSHARHLEWWIEYPDQWVDPNGIPGSDPRSEWTPEEAYQNYLDTHQPLTDYANDPTYQFEAGLGGPIPILKNLFFYGTGRYRAQPPIIGNAFRDKGEFLDGTFKLTYRLGRAKVTLSALYGEEETGWGYFLDNFWANNFGVDSRYAFYDLPGLTESQTDGQTLTYTHVLGPASMFEVSASRVQAKRFKGIFPGDPIGWEAADATRDNLRAVDEEGVPIPGGFSNRIGYHTLGYFDRHDNSNTAWTFKGFYSNQLTKAMQLKTGAEFIGYTLDHFNQAKLPDRTDDAVYKPYQGAGYVQSKFEVGGFIMNAGLRLDFYNPNEDQFGNLFDPLNTETEPATLYTQLSPRLGVSHPIDAKTVLHFSFGQFFQRPPFGDNGEGNDAAVGSLTTFVLDEDPTTPWVLGNRNLNPEKTTAFEVGIERNFLDFFLLDVTGFYKDVRNTIRTVTIETPNAIYRTNGNGDYADESGLELSLRKVPSIYSWGTISGYANYTTRSSILGRSGDPVVISPDGVRFAPSGDFIVPNNNRLKMGLFYRTPGDWSGLFGSLFSNLSLSVDYRATFPNDDLRQDFFLFEGEKHLRPADTRTDLRIRKEIYLAGQRGRISPYVEITNLLNDKWLFLAAFERASIEDQRRLVESNFEDLPAVDANGRPILDISKFRNLPRQVVWGVSIEL